jgi:hypothetical protein
MSLHQIDKITIFGHDDRIALPARFEDLSISRMAQAEVTKSDCLNCIILSDPFRDRRIQMCINPDNHAFSSRSCHHAASRG